MFIDWKTFWYSAIFDYHLKVLWIVDETHSIQHSSFKTLGKCLKHCTQVLRHNESWIKSKTLPKLLVKVLIPTLS